MTAAQKIGLGLSRRDAGAARVPRPEAAPLMRVVAVVGRTVKLRLGDAASPTRRGKPAGVEGASLFRYVGEAAPDDLRLWQFAGSTSRAAVDVTFEPAVAAGSRVWFTAFWFNPRKQSGPTAAAVGTYLQGGMAMAA